MPPSPLDFLKHIQDELQYLIETSDKLSAKTFSQDPTYQRAFARSLEIIGEATKKLDTCFIEKYPGIEWSDLAKLRDKLIHHYFGIDYELVWAMITEDAPLLKSKIDRILSDPE